MFPSGLPLAPHGGCNWEGCKECFPHKERTMPSDGITCASDIADIIYEVLKLNKIPGGEVVAVYTEGIDKVDVTLFNGRRYLIDVKRTNPNDVE